MADPKPPLEAELVWQGDLRFEARAGTSQMVVDGDAQAGPSPMQALAFAVGGCMAADVAAILTKGRHPVTGLQLKVAATRATEHPRRFTHLELAFSVSGSVPSDAVDRAITLSRDKYCSALLSLRQDITVHTSFAIEP